MPSFCNFKLALLRPIRTTHGKLMSDNEVEILEWKVDDGVALKGLLVVVKSRWT